MMNEETTQRVKRKLNIVFRDEVHMAAAAVRETLSASPKTRSESGVNGPITWTGRVLAETSQKTRDKKTQEWTDKTKKKSGDGGLEVYSLIKRADSIRPLPRTGPAEASTHTDAQ